MYRHNERNYHDNTGLQHRLQWMKSKSCPRRGVSRQVMDLVKNGKDAGVVHQPMHPIEVGIVDNQHDGNAHHEIKRSKVLPPGVQVGISPHRCHKQPITNRSKNEGGWNGIHNLPTIILDSGESQLDFTITPFLSPDSIKNEKSQTCQNQVPEEGDQENEVQPSVSKPLHRSIQRKNWGTCKLKLHFFRLKGCITWLMVWWT